MRLYYWAACAACLALLAVGCNEPPTGDDFADKHYGAQGAVAIPSNVETGFFDLANPDEAGIAFDLDTKGEDVSQVEITITHEDGAQATYETLSSFPQTVEVPLDALLSALNIPTDSVQVGDEVLFTFDVDAASGRYRSNEVLSIPFSCESDLSGKLDYVTSNYFCSGDPLSGEVEMTETGAGKYTFDDWTFGSYQECYGGPAAGFGSLEFVDVCNVIDIAGVDGYGDGWAFQVDDVSGSEMTITWSNDYGEFGTTVLTRQDGENWPSLTN